MLYSYVYVKNNSEKSPLDYEELRAERERLTTPAGPVQMEIDLLGFIDKHNLGIYKEKPYRDGHTWALEHCPFNEKHINGSSTVSRFSGGIWFRCFHNSCRGRSWADVLRLYGEDVPAAASTSHSSSPAEKVAILETVLVKNISESERARKLIRARKRSCYLNAFRVVMSLPEYAEATYVEGMAVLPGGALVEHGWVERDGVIIDPTLTGVGFTYFPGLRFQGQVEVAKAMEIPKPKYSSEDLPFFYRFGWGGADNAEFSKARERAWAFCKSLSVRSE